MSDPYQDHPNNPPSGGGDSTWSSVGGSTRWVPGTVNSGSITAINAKTQYGAKGDGVTDDTTAIQNALNAAHTSGGGIVYLPLGVYLVSSTLLLYSYVKLVGASRWSTMVKFKAGTSAGTDMIALASARQEQVSVAAMTLHGNDLGRHGIYISTDSATNGAFASGLNNPRNRFEDLLILHMGADGLHLEGDAFGGASEATGVQTYFCAGNGVYTNVPDCVFTDCDSGQSGLYGFQDAAGYNRFSGCKAWLSGRITPATGDGFRVTAGEGHSTFFGCHAQDNAQNGFNFFGRSGIVATGCVADTNGAGAGAFGNGFYLQNAQGCIIQGIAFDRRPGGAAAVQNYGAYFDGATKCVISIAGGTHIHSVVPSAQLATDNIVIASAIGENSAFSTNTGRSRLQVREEALGLLSEPYPLENTTLTFGHSASTAHLSAVGLKAGDPVPSVVILPNGLPVGTTPTGIYTVILDSTGKCLAISGEFGTAFLAYTVQRQRGIPVTTDGSTVWAAPSDGIYYVGVWMNGSYGTTQPSYFRGNNAITNTAAYSPYLRRAASVSVSGAPVVGTTYVLADSQNSIWCGAGVS